MEEIYGPSGGNAGGGSFRPSGMSTRPDDVPERPKNRFGQVGPGSDENQRSQTVKSPISPRYRSAVDCPIDLPPYSWL